MGTPRPNIFPKNSNIAYGWESYSGGAISGILGYFQDILCDLG